jgi:hypothetical protein
LKPFVAIGALLMVGCGHGAAVEPSAPANLPGKEPSMEITTSKDRQRAPDVPSVERGGVRYEQASDGRDVGADTVDGVLVATDAKSGKLLWVLTVYRTKIDPALETDVQWRFFTAMAFDSDGRLRITNEAAQTFLVDVAARTVTAAR